MRNILLSPIGRSPGAVTGIYYALADRDIAIDKVVLLSTAMPWVQRAGQMVERTLGKDKVLTLPLKAADQPSHDFNDAATVLNFIQLANAVLDHARRAGDAVHIGISGGRSSMGALATLSAYVYGAAGVYHLWVEERLEEQGDIKDLNRMRGSARMCILKPPKDQYRLVSVPLMPFDTLWDRGRLPDVLAAHPQTREALLRMVTDVEVQQFKRLRRAYAHAQTIGLRPGVYKRLQETLLRCGPFDDAAALRALFVDARISPWRNAVPGEKRPDRLVRATIDTLCQQHEREGTPALILLLRVLSEQRDRADVCHRDLDVLAHDLEQEDAWGKAPASSSARQAAIYKDVAAETRAIFQGTSLEQAVEKAIQLSDTGATVEDLIKMAQQLEPYFKPSLWTQVQEDLRDWESWKQGADRLLQFVEAVAQPLAVGGLAATLGIVL